MDVDVTPMEWLLSDSHFDVIRPGDTLVVRMSSRLTQQQAHEVKTALEDRLPDVKVVVIGCDGLAVYRPNEITT